MLDVAHASTRRSYRTCAIIVAAAHHRQRFRGAPAIRLGRPRGSGTRGICGPRTSGGGGTAEACRQARQDPGLEADEARKLLAGIGV
jgi:hypothetical protein